VVYIRCCLPLVVGASDVGDASVGGEDDDGGGLAFQGPVEEGEALHVEHVDLVDEEHSGHDFSLALLSPLRHLLVDLLPHLLRDFSSGSGEQREESLRAGVDDVDLVQGDSVHHLLPLLDFALGAVHEPGLRAHRVVVGCAGEAAARLRDLARCLVDSDHVSRNDLLLLDSVDHLLAQIVNRLHLGGLEGDLAGLGSRG
jgi:hypothetical protein